MDRREALKKLGAGGAVAIGASAIVSSPAFAFRGPTPPATPGLAPTLSGGVIFGNRILTLTMSPGTATCPASAVPAGATVIASSFTASPPTPGNGLASVSPPTGSTIGSGSLAVTFTRDTISFFGLTFGAAATATFEYRVRYRCTYARPGQADTCRSWTIQYTAAAFGEWSITPSISTGSACP